MSTYDNAPPPDDWRPEPRPDPFRKAQTSTASGTADIPEREAHLILGAE